MATRQPALWFVIHVDSDQFCDCEEDGLPALKSADIARRYARELDGAGPLGTSHGTVKYVEAPRRRRRDPAGAASGLAPSKDGA